MLFSLLLGATLSLASTDTPEAEAAPAETPVSPVQAPTIPGQVSPDSPHYDLEVLYDLGEHETGMALAKRRLDESPEDPVLAWMYVRFMYEIGENQLDRPRKGRLAWYEEMVTVMETALERYPNDPHLHFAYSVALGRYSTTKGIMAVLRTVDDLEVALHKSIPDDFAYRSIGGAEHLPCHSYLALGVFYRLVPDSWLIKALTGTRGSLTESVRWLEMADACQPDAVQITKELAASRMCLGQKEKNEALVQTAVDGLERIPQLTNIMHSDIIDREHAKLLLEDPKMACGYSRDGQQEVDMKNAEKEARKNGTSG